MAKATMECVICGRRGAGVRPWGIILPGGTVARTQLCYPHAAPLRMVVSKSIRERRQIGANGLDALVEVEPV